ncbi:MAG: hypothetical protein Q8O64_05780 [Sideroxyarcus sp.]|nr:hypothetical protein [Sideroxyarcus sp.]
MVRPKFNAKGDPVYRAISTDDEGDGQKLLDWYLSHPKGRAHTKATFGEIHFSWNGPASKKVADYPSCTVPSGVWSAKAVEALKPFFEANGDLFRIVFEGGVDKYVLFDCWSEFEAKTNDDFFFLKPKTLRYLKIGADVTLTDVFFASDELMVSERFKAAAEAAGLTGIDFTEVEVILGS